jgi:hypothetical protein
MTDYIGAVAGEKELSSGKPPSDLLPARVEARLFEELGEV